MDINYDDLLHEITKTFPPISFVFCYGSAAFPQAGYNYSKETPMIDLIFIVENFYEWNQENFSKNRAHYSGFGYLIGPPLLSFLERKFIPIHYNPYVTLGKFQVKYGVASVKEVLNNLENWENLILAGRMQKPIRILRNSSVLYSEKILAAMQSNYISAMSLAFLMNFDQFVQEKMLYNTICSLSFIGDIRMVLGLEKQDKIQGIVDKQEENFRQIYVKIMRELSLNTIIKYHEKEKKFEIIGDLNRTKNELIQNVPYGIGISFTGVNKDYQGIMKTKNLDEVQEHIVKSLKWNNFNYSIRLIAYHFVTTSFIKNFVYSWKKLMKRLKK